MHDLIDKIESCDFFSQSTPRLPSASEDIAQTEHDGLDLVAHGDIEQHAQTEVWWV